MLTGRVRYQVEDRNGGVFVVIDHHPVDPETAALVDEVAARLLAEARALGIADPAASLAAIIVQQIADEQAYEREAQRRGVLPL